MVDNENFPPEFLYIVQNRGEWPIHAFEQIHSAAFHVATEINKDHQPVCYKVRLSDAVRMKFTPPVVATLEEEIDKDRTQT